MSSCLQVIDACAYWVLKIMISNYYCVSVLTSLVSQFPGIIDLFLELEFIQNATRILLQYQGENTCSSTSLLKQSLKSSYEVITYYYNQTLYGGAWSGTEVICKKHWVAIITTGQEIVL